MERGKQFAARVENDVHNAVDKIDTKLHDAKRIIERTAHDAKDKTTTYLNKLRRNDWTDYEEEALRFGSVLAAYMTIPLVMKPFRNLQILQQLDKHGPDEEPKYNGYIQGMKTITQEEGFRGLFKGGIAQSVYEVARFSGRAIALRALVTYLPSTFITDQYVPFIGAAIEMITDTIAYPLSTASTRLIAQPGYTKYDGVLDALEKIAHEDEPISQKNEVDLNPFKPTWYAGLVPHLVSISVFTATDVLSRYVFDKAFGLGGDIIYEANIARVNPIPVVKLDVEGETIINIKTETVYQVKDVDYVVLIRNPFCLFLAMLASYPFEVISRRQQAGDREYKNKNVIQALVHIIEKEGYKGLYKGLLFN